LAFVFFRLRVKFHHIFRRVGLHWKAKQKLPSCFGKIITKELSRNKALQHRTLRVLDSL
jgi:hypothetical protein